MPTITIVPANNRVRIGFETDVETARRLRDLVKFYKLPVAGVIETLIRYEHESIKLKDEPRNDFVQTPRKVEW